MKTTLLLPLFILATATGCSQAAQAEPAASKIAWQGEIAQNDTVYARSINGRIRVVASNGNAVVVRAKATGGAKVEVVPHAGGVTICGIPSAKSYSCDKSGQLTVNGKSSSNSKVHLEIAAPKNAILDLSTVNGSVKITNVGQTARATTVNGSLKIETSGPVDGTTVNGSINVAIAKLAGPGDIELETVNGSITLVLPSTVNADVNAKLVHGSIKTKRTLAGAKQKRHKLTGRLGQGGRKVTLRTVNGSIKFD